MEKLEEAKAAYGRITDALADFEFRIENAARAAQQGEWPDLTLRAEAARLRFSEHMDDDLNTAGAFGELFALVGETAAYLAAVDRGEAPLDAEALVAVCDVLCESLEVLLVPLPAGPRRSRDRHLRRGRRRCLRHRRRRSAPAARLAEEERWDDVELVFADRLACGDASYACVLRDHLPRREGLGRRRPDARRDPGGRLRGARHPAGHPGRAPLSAAGSGEQA